MPTTQQLLLHGEGSIELKIPSFSDLPLNQVPRRLDRYHESSITNLDIVKPLVNTPLLTTPDLRQGIWKELQRAVLDRRHEWRTPVLATVDVDGMPQARTVVLRRADARQASLQFFTDRRSPKVAELEATPSVSMVFWSPRLSWQLRISAAATVQRDEPDVDAVWGRIGSSPAAADYLAATAPGKPQGYEHEARPTDPSAHHLAIVTLKVLCMDWLNLAHTGHRRAKLTDQECEWCVP